MDKFIDVHCHVLPSIDDGSKSMEQSLNMVKIAAEENIGAMILTPHYHPAKGSHNIENWRDTLELLKKETCRVGIDMEFYLGTEIFYTQDVPDNILNGKVITMAGSDYVLVEFRTETEYSYIKSAVYDIISSGKTPIIAHIERYMCLLDKAERIEELRDKGAVIQVNASSITGDMGFSVKRFLKKLLKKGFIDLIGTDAHSDNHRAPRMLDCFKYISKKFDEDYAYELMRYNALKLIANEEI